MKALSQDFLIGITLIKMKRYISVCIKKLQETLNFFMYTFSEKCKNIIIFQNIVFPFFLQPQKMSQYFSYSHFFLIVVGFVIH